MRQRNAPLKGLLKKSPIKNNLKDYFKTAVKVVKPLVGKAAKKALGPVGLLLGATKTATADQPNFPSDSVHYRDPKKSMF
jgi:hypothetical protein|tara:strand:+ start:112 stop:351 length:240 start_codon:yes stop_codon:yes gene_type:complete